MSVQSLNWILAISVMALVALSCSTAGGDPPGTESTPTGTTSTRTFPTTLSQDDAPLLGRVWDYHASSTDGMDISTIYTVLGAAQLGATPAYILGAALTDQSSSVVEYSAFYMAVDGFDWIDRAGAPVIDEPDLLTATLTSGDIESITVPAGQFEATRTVLESDGATVTSWTSSDVIRPVKTESTRSGRSMVEELTSVSTVVADVAADEFYLTLVDAIAEGNTRESRNSALKSLANLYVLFGTSEIVEILQNQAIGPDIRMAGTAERALGWIEDGRATRGSLDSSPVTGSKPPGNSSPQPAGPALLAGIGLVADAFEIVTGVASLGGDTEVLIKHPSGCEGGTLPIALDVGDVVANMPLEVDFSLSFWRDWGLWELPFPILSNLSATYKNELKFKTSDGGITVLSVVGGDGFDMELANIQDVIWAHNWVAQDGPTVDDVKIEATIRQVTKGVDPSGQHGDLTWWNTESAECTLRFSVFNPFYAGSEDYSPSNMDNDHHDSTEHSAGFVLRKRPKGTQFARPPQGWVIESLEQQDEDWTFAWSLRCAGTVLRDPHCLEHTASTDEGVFKSGFTESTKRPETSVETRFRTAAMASHVPELPVTPCTSSPLEHEKQRLCFLEIELAASAFGSGRTGPWSTESMLIGPSVNARRLPIERTISDYDEKKPEFLALAPGTYPVFFTHMAQNECASTIAPPDRIAIITIQGSRDAGNTINDVIIDDGTLHRGQIDLVTGQFETTDGRYSGFLLDREFKAGYVSANHSEQPKITFSITLAGCTAVAVFEVAITDR